MSGWIFLEDKPTKIERYLLIERVGSQFIITPSSSTYILIPPDIISKLKRDFYLDVRNSRDIEKRCMLALERGEDGKEVVRLIYEFRRVPQKRG